MVVGTVQKLYYKKTSGSIFRLWFPNSVLTECFCKKKVRLFMPRIKLVILDELLLARCRLMPGPWRDSDWWRAPDEMKIERQIGKIDGGQSSFWCSTFLHFHGRGEESQRWGGCHQIVLPIFSGLRNRLHWWVGGGERGKVWILVKSENGL